MKLKNEYSINELIEIVNEVNSWNGMLESLYVIENNEYTINDYLCSMHPSEVLRMAYFGDYNYNDEYIRFNAYGNLESLSEYEYESELKDCEEDIIESALYCLNHLYLNDDLKNKIESEEK